MASSDAQTSSKLQRVLMVIGWVISLLVAAGFAFSGVMKLMGGEELEQSMADIGLPATMLLPLAILELTCLAIYLLPPTAVLGAILLTGYLGGAICTHWRVGEPVAAPVVMGVLVWLGIYLREPRLWKLVPWRAGRCCS